MATRRRGKTEDEIAQEFIKKRCDPDGFKVVTLEGKGNLYCHKSDRFKYVVVRKHDNTADSQHHMALVVKSNKGECITLHR